jgi:pyridoxine 4-dehydrogenase
MPSDYDRTTNGGAHAAPGLPPEGRAFLAGRPVQRIGFGAMQLPGPGVWGPPADRDAALAVLRQAIDLGVNHIDTAQYYGDGVANELIRSALHPYPDDLVLVSKVGSERDAHGAWIPAQRPEQLRAGVEANLRALGVDRLDVVNLRLIDRRSMGGAPDPQHVDLDDQLAEMVALREEGLIGGIGLSNAGTDELRRALPVGIACVQNAFSVLDRSAAPVLGLCREHDVPWVPFFPLGSAFPNRPKVPDHPVVVEVAARVEATPAQVGLAWLLAHHENTLLIPGTSSAQHLQENVASGEVRLDAAARAALDALGDTPGPVR